MDEQKYRIRMNERAIELIMHKDEYDPDIWNLEYMITQIMPYSTNWRSGCIRSLRKAINALKEEKNHARSGKDSLPDELQHPSR